MFKSHQVARQFINKNFTCIFTIFCNNNPQRRKKLIEYIQQGEGILLQKVPYGRLNNVCYANVINYAITL